jgi:D-amino-acid dehydrogenase
MNRAVVIGGGIVGIACSYFLSKRGWHVTLLDRGRIGGGCSHANCGYISPSHVLPLAEPGAVRKALKAMITKDSPFRIKPRPDAALWKWLYHFARRCNTDDMLTAGHAIQAILDSSRSLYGELIPAEGLDCEWETLGMLFVYDTRGGYESFAQTDDLLAEHFNLPARRIEGEALAEFEPALRPGLAGGFFYEDDAHVRPNRLLAEWRRVLAERGVEIVENCEFQGFVDQKGRQSGGVASNGAPHRVARIAVASCGEFEADAFVVATGAWTPLLAQQIGCRVPIQPGKGYSMTMPRPAICPRVPMLLMEHRVGVTPMQSGYRLCSTMEFAGYDTSLRQERLDLLRRGAAACLREPYCEPVEESWYGWRPMTYDSMPVIDRSPAYDNLYLAVGHNMLGLSMAPGTGKLVAELITGDTPHIDPSPYSVARFSGQKAAGRKTEQRRVGSAQQG